MKLSKKAGLLRIAYALEMAVAIRHVKATRLRESSCHVCGSCLALKDVPCGACGALEEPDAEPDAV